MLVYNKPDVQIAFGDKSVCIDAEEYRRIYKSPSFFFQRSCFIPVVCYPLLEYVSFNQIVFLRQTHGTKGCIIDNEQSVVPRPFEKEGDFLITNKRGLGLAIMTADCLPIIFYDSVQQVCAIAHAGWKGSVAGIASVVIEHMKNIFGCSLSSIKIIFGPAAKCCCYEIKNPLVSEVEKKSGTGVFLDRRGQSVYLDLALFNQKIIYDNYDIGSNAFCFDHNLCTICNRSYCSYRRQKIKAGRNLTVVALR